MSYAKVLGATSRQDGFLEGNGYLVTLPADATCRKNTQPSSRPEPGSPYEVQHLKNTDRINGIGKCYSKIKALASKNQAGYRGTPFRRSFPAFPLARPFKPPFPIRNDAAISRKNGSRQA